ncbi:TPA: ead/Ea22-like family protein [Klebsiella pneumoniae]
MTDITELAQREKFEAWFVNDVVGADVNFPAFKDGEYTEGEIYDEQLYFMLQAMWMAWKAAGAELVEALEKSQRYIERLREWNAGLAQESCERQQLISELEPIRAAAEKLVRCKGRYHSEQNYRALAALFGVKTPDLPPLEHENVHYADAAEMEIEALRQRIAELEESNAQVIQSRDHYKRMTEEGLKQLAEARTVKLPKPHAHLIWIQAGHAPDDYWDDVAVSHSEKDRCCDGSERYPVYARWEIEEMMSAAGIKVEAE